MKNQILVIKTTYPNLLQAQNLAELLISQKLAACVQFCEISSIFSWNNKITSEKEILVNIKTTANLYNQVEKVILDHHPYQIPQIIAVKCENVLANYAAWIEQITL